MWPFNTKKKIIAGAQEALDRSQEETTPYTTIIHDKEFIVLPGVFSPKYFRNTDTLFAEHLPIKKGDEVLEIGPGTGVIAILLTYRGAKRVLTVEINPMAIENTRKNIAKHGLEEKVEVHQGSVYSPIKEGEKFDVITWNLPFGFIKEGQKISDIHKALYDPGYKATEEFITQADEYLKPGGHIYMGFSTSMGELKLIKRFCKRVSRQVRVIFKQSAGGVNFEILEAIKVF